MCVKFSIPIVNLPDQIVLLHLVRLSRPQAPYKMFT
jgi:hypothetical protein